jgi:hypothetical protein
MTTKRIAHECIIFALARFLRNSPEQRPSKQRIIGLYVTEEIGGVYYTGLTCF